MYGYEVPPTEPLIDNRTADQIVKDAQELLPKLVKVRETITQNTIQYEGRKRIEMLEKQGVFDGYAKKSETSLSK